MELSVAALKRANKRLEPFKPYLPYFYFALSQIFLVIFGLAAALGRPDHYNVPLAILMTERVVDGLLATLAACGVIHAVTTRSARFLWPKHPCIMAACGLIFLAMTYGNVNAPRKLSLVVYFAVMMSSPAFVELLGWPFRQRTRAGTTFVVFVGAGITSLLALAAQGDNLMSSEGIKLALLASLSSAILFHLGRLAPDELVSTRVTWMLLPSALVAVVAAATGKLPPIPQPAPPGYYMLGLILAASGQLYVWFGPVLSVRPVKVGKVEHKVPPALLAPLELIRVPFSIGCAVALGQKMPSPLQWLVLGLLVIPAAVRSIRPALIDWHKRAELTREALRVQAEERHKKEARAVAIQAMEVLVDSVVGRLPPKNKDAWDRLGWLNARHTIAGWALERANDSGDQAAVDTLSDFFDGTYKQVEDACRELSAEFKSADPCPDNVDESSPGYLEEQCDETCACAEDSRSTVHKK